MGLSEENKEWLDYWVPKAEAGDPEAQIALGWEYQKGELLAKDIDAAKRWFMAAENECPELGYFNLMKMMSIEDHHSIDEIFRISEWRMGAIYYIYGWYRAQKGADNAELADLFTLGSKRGHLPSQIRMHQIGRSVWSRLWGFPYEAKLIGRALVIWWRNRDDVRVVR
jgi:hypothetical protein